jgi:hypothetical protein
VAIHHELIRIDPARYPVVERELLALTANSANELAALFKAFDRELQAPVVDAFARAFASSETAQRRFRTEMLPGLVSEKSWDLDKALPYLAEIVATVPQLQALRPFMEFRACEVRIDKRCRGDQFGGLVSLWNAAALEDCRDVLDSFTHVEIAQEIANSASDPQLCHSVDQWTGAYLWAAWEQLADAIRETTAEKVWLGCVVS